MPSNRMKIVSTRCATNIHWYKQCRQWQCYVRSSNASVRMLASAILHIFPIFLLHYLYYTYIVYYKCMCVCVCILSFFGHYQKLMFQCRHRPSVCWGVQMFTTQDDTSFFLSFGVVYPFHSICSWIEADIQSNWIE